MAFGKDFKIPNFPIDVAIGGKADAGTIVQLVRQPYVK